MSRGNGRGHADHPGLMVDAEALGVDPSHLWRVLVGERESRRLLAAYQALHDD